MENSKLQQEITSLQVNQALLEQKQAQTETVISELKDTLKNLNVGLLDFENKVTKGFYVAVGVVLMASGQLTEIVKALVKAVG